MRVSERQFAHLNDMLRDACYILDLDEVPADVRQQDPLPNAMCIGLDEPIIVLTTGLVELLDEEEMRFVVGHEVGHALSGHAVYRTILLFLTNLGDRGSPGCPLGHLGHHGDRDGAARVVPQVGAVRDRAGLLVGQDLEASRRALMKIAGGNHLHEMNVDAFLEQAEEYEAGGDLRDSVLKILHAAGRTRSPPSGARAEEVGRPATTSGSWTATTRGATRTGTPRSPTRCATRPTPTGSHGRL